MRIGFNSVYCKVNIVTILQVLEHKELKVMYGLSMRVKWE
jgi:hypothetical protein